MHISLGPPFLVYENERGVHTTTEKLRLLRWSSFQRWPLSWRERLKLNPEDPSLIQDLVKQILRSVATVWNDIQHFTVIFSHTQLVSVTQAITLCPSSLSAAAWTFFVFRLLLSNRCTDLLQVLCGCFLGGPLLNLLKSGCYLYFSWNYG